MGSCVSSAHKRGPETAAAAMKMNVPFGSKTESHVIPLSPVKEKPANGDGPINGWSPSTFKDFGSKEENFFDSQAWLESDCEDDFYSVRGDFTPSRGNTPVHHSFSTGTPRVNDNSKSSGSSSTSSPTEKRKKLAELFQQSSKEDTENPLVVDPQGTPVTQTTPNGKKPQEKPTVLNILPKSANNTPQNMGTTSACSSRWTPNADLAMENEKPMKSVSRCLPSFASCRGSDERKKKMGPTMVAINGSS